MTRFASFARFIAIPFVLAAVAAPARSEDTMLQPPGNHYFVSKGSWKQTYPDQWGLQRIGFDASPTSAWRLVKRDASPVVVAVIDSGLDWNHKNFAWENLWRNPAPSTGGYANDRIGWDFFDQDGKPWDYDGHGTMVAGIIAASWTDADGMAGVNPFARLMVLKAVNNFGHTRDSYLAEAIGYAADHGARVINISVGDKGVSKVLQTAVDYAYSKNAVIVVAAGNEGVNLKGYGIAESDKVLTVAATGFDDQRLGFSNWGKISVAAPGLDILSLRGRRTDVMLGLEGVKYTAGGAYVGPDKRYYRASGTSFAAPFVAGLASLMIANDPTLTNRQVMDIIKSTARSVGALGVDQFTGYGIIDARAALKAPKDFKLLVGVNRVEVVQSGGNQLVRVHGQVDANMLKDAVIEIGQGEAPTKWTRIGAANKSGESDGVLGDVPATALKGAKVWQIRVVATHASGAQREARFRLSLG